MRLPAVDYVTSSSPPPPPRWSVRSTAAARTRPYPPIFVQDRAFASFQVESKFRNIIGLEVGLANLTQALRAGQNALHVQLKLIKKGNLPYLSVEAQTVDGGLSVVQDVPVRVLSAAELGRHSEPYIPVPQVRRGRAGMPRDGVSPFRRPSAYQRPYSVAYPTGTPEDR